MSRTTPSRDARPTTDQAPRDAARQLADQGISNREIGRRLGVSEATVRRWRKADAPDAAPDLGNVAPSDAATAQPEPTATQERQPNRNNIVTPGSGDAPATQPTARDDAPADAITLVPDDDLRAALAVLAEAGLSAPAALRQCALFVAGAVTHGWEHGAFPRGLVPSMQVEFGPAPTRPIILLAAKGTDQLR